MNFSGISHIYTNYIDYDWKIFCNRSFSCIISQILDRLNLHIYPWVKHRVTTSTYCFHVNRASICNKGEGTYGNDSIILHIKILSYRSWTISVEEHTIINFSNFLGAELLYDLVFPSFCPNLLGEQCIMLKDNLR